MKDTITIQYDGKSKTVSRDAYEKAKLKQLREFGYPSLTLEEVRKQVDLVLDGKTKFGEEGFTVVGMFIKDEVQKP